MKRVLVVDDSTFMRTAIIRILSSQGYEVVGEGGSGKIGVEKYKELLPDIVTMDITMNEMTGLEALTEIIKFDPAAKVVMVSAMGQEPFVKEAIAAGAKGFLVKPFQTDTVVTALAKL